MFISVKFHIGRTGPEHPSKSRSGAIQSIAVTPEPACFDSCTLTAVACLDGSCHEPCDPGSMKVVRLPPNRHVASFSLQSGAPCLQHGSLANGDHGTIGFHPAHGNLDGNVVSQRTVGWNGDLNLVYSCLTGCQ